MPDKRLWSQKILHRRATIVPMRIDYTRSNDLSYDFEQYKDLKKSTEAIHFTCFDANANGKCAKRIKEKNERCCCSGCYSSLGFFEFDDLVFEKDFEIYNKLFDSEPMRSDDRNYHNPKGFWRPNTGCILPRELRSKTCITYNCEKRHVRMMLRALDAELVKMVNRIKLRLVQKLCQTIMTPRIKKKWSSKPVELTESEPKQPKDCDHWTT